MLRRSQHSLRKPTTLHGNDSANNRIYFTNACKPHKNKKSNASAREHMSLNTQHKASMIKRVQREQNKQTIASLKPAVSLSCAAILSHSFYLNKAAHQSHTHSLHRLTRDAPISSLAAKRGLLCTFSAARVSTAAALERRSEGMALGEEVVGSKALQHASSQTDDPSALDTSPRAQQDTRSQASIWCCPTLISSSSSAVRSMAFHMQTSPQAKLQPLLDGSAFSPSIIDGAGTTCVCAPIAEAAASTRTSGPSAWYLQFGQRKYEKNQ